MIWDILIHELDGWEDENGRLMMQMTEDLSLETINRRALCESLFTWSARESRTCIDYVLVSQSLAQYLVHVHIGEAGEHIVSGLGSDHNRLKLQLSMAT